MTTTVCELVCLKYLIDAQKCRAFVDLQFVRRLLDVHIKSLPAFSFLEGRFFHISFIIFEAISS